MKVACFCLVFLHDGLEGLHVGSDWNDIYRSLLVDYLYLARDQPGCLIRDGFFSLQSHYHYHIYTEAPSSKAFSF